MTEHTENNTYQKELNDIRNDLLSRPDQYITFRDLVERFDEVDEEFNHSSWNLLQIYSNFDILIGTEREDKYMNKTIENLKKLKSFHNGSYGADIDKAIKALEKQDVLNQIRAEIEGGYCKKENDYDSGRNMGLHIAIQIIDKYIKGE